MRLRTQTSASRTIFVVTCLLMFVLSACSTTSTTTNTQGSSSTAASGTESVPMPEAAQGYWETVEGNLTLSENPGKIYFYDWYAIEPQSAERVTIVWDNGLNCARTEGMVQGNAVHLTADNVETTFVIHDPQNATVTFRHGDTTYTKKLQKKRDDPSVVCA